MALLFSTVMSLSAHAVDIPALFTAQVAIDDEAEDPRNDAYKAALIEVLTRVSGTALGQNTDAIDDMFPVPSAYVTQFRPGADESLLVSFDGEAIESVLRANGQLVWGSGQGFLALQHLLHHACGYVGCPIVLARIIQRIIRARLRASERPP